MNSKCCTSQKSSTYLTNLFRFSQGAFEMAPVNLNTRILIDGWLIEQIH